MNLFAVADLHRNEELRDAVIEEANSGDYDLFIAVGDYEEADYYESLIAPLQLPFIALTGNWDFGFQPPENGEYERLFNYKEVEFRDYRIVLLGSVYPDDFQEQVAAFFDGVPNGKRIVASHYPPHMLGDLTRMGTRAGFTEFRELIMREKPALWLTGHIHEDFGKYALMNTLVLNCAAIESGKAWRITFNDAGVNGTEEVVLVE